MMLNQNLIKTISKETSNEVLNSIEIDPTDQYFESSIHLEELDQLDNQPKTRKRIKGQSFTPEYYRCTKNIAKNYGKAIASFAGSDLVVPYLQNITISEPCTLSEFIGFVRTNKDVIQGIDSFRAMLLPSDEDDIKQAAFKRIFQKVSEIFIKYFSVNWICHGKMKDKETYLKFRFKILRRIQNPTLFTYVKKSKKHTQPSS